MISLAQLILLGVMKHRQEQTRATRKLVLKVWSLGFIVGVAVTLILENL